MLQQFSAHPRKIQFSLSTYISLLLAIMAVVPLLATVVSLEFILRPSLIGQVTDALEKDAQTKVHLIEQYLIERLNEVQAVSQSTPIKNFITGDQTARNGAFEALFTAQHRDVSNYVSWSLLDASGNVALSYPSAPAAHGKYFILPEASQQLQKSGNVLISNVFYDNTNNQEFVDLYAHVVDNTFHLVGFIRASLDLRRIWATVDSETQDNGPGSYGTLVDENGVRIAYTNVNPANGLRPTPLLKIIAPPSADLKQRVASENLYGNSDLPLTVLADSKLTEIQSQQQPPSTFEFNPVEQNQAFAAARYSSTIVPWTYFVMKPLSAVTGLADQQLLTTWVIAFLFVSLAVFVGLWTGKRITLPILRSVDSLRKNSLILKELANEEYQVVSEQAWMVEASQMGLGSIRYYTNANNIASGYIATVGIELLRNSDHPGPQNFRETMQHIVGSADYIRKVVKHQEAVNDKLETTLRVTDQITDQLTKSAQSADQAATQMEQIVGQLTAVVGGQDELQIFGQYTKAVIPEEQHTVARQGNR